MPVDTDAVRELLDPLGFQTVANEGVFGLWPTVACRKQITATYSGFGGSRWEPRERPLWIGIRFTAGGDLSTPVLVGITEGGEDFTGQVVRFKDFDQLRNGVHRVVQALESSTEGHLCPRCRGLMKAKFNKGTDGVFFGCRDFINKSDGCGGKRPGPHEVDFVSGN